MTMNDPVDDELRVTAALAAARRDELVAEGRPGMADYMNEVAAAAAGLRDQRRALAREVEDAMVAVTDLGILPDDDPPDPGRQARLAAAVAEWQAKRAKPVMVRRRELGDEVPFRLECPKGHSTVAELWETSAGLLFTAAPPAPHVRKANPRRVPFATLLDGAGSYDLECVRCQPHGACRFDLAEIRRRLLARGTMYRAT
jgi:hypothetical protein